MEINNIFKQDAKSLVDTLENYLKNKGGTTEKKFDKLIKTLTLEDLYATK